MASSKKLVLPKPFTVNAFTADKMSGSSQLIYLFHDRDTYTEACQNFTTKEEKDSSLVLIENKEIVNVQWRNKSGEVKLCGSAAYALSWWLFRDQNFEGPITIQSPHYKLTSFLDDNRIILKLPRIDSYELRPGPKGEECFFYATSDLMLVMLNSRSELREFEPTSQYLARSSALGAFYWSKSDGEGYVRYFAPRHGRSEDSVTGSIHCSLTPLVSDYFGSTQQKWTQLSEPGGQLSTLLTDAGVLIYGQCRYRRSRKEKSMSV